MMSWKAIPLILAAGMIALVVLTIQMRKNQEEVLFNSVGYALDQLHRDLGTKTASGHEVVLEAWRPYLRATPQGRLPGFVDPTDVFMAKQPVGQTNAPEYLVVVKIGDKLLCGLRSDGTCIRMTHAQFGAWPHKALAP